ncbi:MAG: endopeptidase La [Deferribacterota bacterium]|nr:endopeptidase La [Deferribacterota bacterium]
MENILENINIPETLPLLPIRDIVVFPYMIIPLYVGRENSIAAVDESLKRDRLIFLTAQKEVSIEEPKLDDLYSIGVVASVLRMLKMPDGRVKILVQGLKRCKILDVVKEKPFLEVKILVLEDAQVEITLEVEALIKNTKELLSKAVNLGKQMLPDLLAVIESIEDPGKLADIVVANLGLKVKEHQEILEITNPVDRLQKVNEYLNKEIALLEVQQRIFNRAKGEIDKSQREYFLREQLKAIKKELGEDEEGAEIKEFTDKINKTNMPKEVKEEALKQVNRLSRMHPDSAEATVVRTYIEWLVELPWDNETEDNLDLEHAKKILDEDHYGLKDVKERILDFLAVRKLNKKMKSPILCFIGPPGVGKTSLGKSIARAMGRKFVRMSLGGVRDEAEIRGHRRTYIGALPGKIIQGIRNAGSKNPVFVLDEIDKIGMDFRGDPSSALLEVLDPEQNNSFVDHYLGVPFDLSNVFFITTANYQDPIPPALLDRMEVIRIPGYSEEEKIQIAKRFLLQRQIKENGLDKTNVKFSDNAIKLIIEGYTRESGLRNLERHIATLCRKIARKVAEGNNKKFIIGEKTVEKYLGPRIFFSEEELKANEIGVATGLAWTPSGGEVLYVECTRYPGKGELILTGQLGDVMKESARAALTYVRSIANKFDVKANEFSKYDIHLHVPAGAIPKDGPSAGVTMAVAILSAFARIKIRRDVAMTGEITITGKVLPVGGIKEKVLAARRIGMKKIVLPKKNEKDIVNLPNNIARSIQFVFVESFDEIPEIAFEKNKTKTTVS